MGWILLSHHEQEKEPRILGNSQLTEILCVALFLFSLVLRSHTMMEVWPEAGNNQELVRRMKMWTVGG